MKNIAICQYIILLRCCKIQAKNHEVFYHISVGISFWKFMLVRSCQMKKSLKYQYNPLTLTLLFTMSIMCSMAEVVGVVVVQVVVVDKIGTKFANRLKILL